MAHIKLKVLVEQIQSEATLHPVQSELAEVKKIVLKYLTDREHAKSSSFAKLGREFKEFYYMLRMKNYAAMVLNIDEDLNELNYRLKPHRIAFTTWMNDDTKGSISKDGKVRINAHLAFDKISKVNGEWDIDDLMTTIGHELIHREQYRRGMNKSAYSQKGGDESKYWNDPGEVMTWAYNAVKEIIHENPNITLPELIELVKTDEPLADFLNRYTPNNRKKMVRHIVDYATKALEKEK